MVTPTTPSCSVLVPLVVPNTGKHGLCTGLCANHLGIYSRVLAHVFARLNLTYSPALYPSVLIFSFHPCFMLNTAWVGQLTLQTSVVNTRRRGPSTSP